jgi:hypothetical protein
MSQKSSVPQAVSFVSQVLKRHTEYVLTTACIAVLRCSPLIWLTPAATNLLIVALRRESRSANELYELKSSSSTFASFRSRVSKPSVNQP